MCEFPIEIRDITSGPGFVRLDPGETNGLPDGVHTDGAWLSRDGEEV